METDRLIELLARALTPVRPHVVARRFGWALLAGTLAPALLIIVLYGIRPDIDAMLKTPLFWARVAFPFALAAGALVATARLSRPGVAVGSAWAGIAFPLGCVWLAGLIAWWLAPADARVLLLMGHSWRSCSLNIAFLSIPGVVAALWAVRGLAAPRLRLAGAAAGMMAGATATVTYMLHCPEMGVPFWAVWYVLGIAIPTMAGAIVAPRWLRW